MQPPKSVITLAVIGKEIPHIQKKNATPPNELAGPIIRPHNMEPKEILWSDIHKRFRPTCPL